MAARRRRLVSADRRTGMLWPVIFAATILLAALTLAEAGGGLAVPPVPHAQAVIADPGNGPGRGERDGEAGTGEHEARPRPAARRFGGCRDLVSTPARHAATTRLALLRHMGRPPSTPGLPARPSSRTPGACLLIALNISRT
ncbi:hypothetical protein [Actinomadura rudentiformis]|uniref:Uncharacterized protein n=1 Tax=Actinomadura rudentiformis TaxID=359158 RepID=A0A6H9YHV3_9ACTN|nr:hypothetical protein [Actinomadura rudentiformis]KAB2344767.1 hypothetical protein F8566_29635 [Actinomadura rudentiformis]